MPSVSAVAKIGDRSLRVIGTHPPPPMSNDHYNERNSQLEKLASLASESNIAVTVLGDLNISPWSAHFHNLLQNGSLHSSRKGFGLFPSWPTSQFILQIPIDHILHSGDISTISLESSNGLSSDHKSLWADIQIN